jgi:hypothetical protein
LRSGSAWFASYTILLGLSFGYVVPGIGTNLLKLWRFHGPWKVGNYYWHHGFLYAPYLAVVLWLTASFRAEITLANVVATIGAMAIVQSVLSCHHDYMGLVAGEIEIFNAPARAGAGPRAIILDYAPIGFALFGAAYAGSCLLAYRRLVLGPGPTLVCMIELLAAGLALMTFAGLPYLIRERAYIASVLASRRRQAGPGSGSAIE